MNPSILTYNFCFLYSLLLLVASTVAFHFSKKGKYLGSDSTEKLWFPEIQELKLDCFMENPKTEFFKEISEWINNTPERISYFETNAKIIGARSRDNNTGGHK